MPKLKPGTILPTLEEEAAIDAGIAADPDNPEWTAEAFARARPAGEVLPELFGREAAAQMLKPRGRPKAAVTKERITIRLSRDVVEQFRAGGTGWQTRMDEALRDWLRSHPPGR